MSINIPHPCNANWEQMSIGIASRHCASCSKNVIDFRHQSKENILKTIIANKNTSICGRFKQTQIDFSIIDEAIAIYGSKRPITSRISSPFVLLSLAIALSGCQESNSIQAQSHTEVAPIDSSKMDVHSTANQAPEIMGRIVPPNPVEEIMGEIVLMPSDTSDVYIVAEKMPQFKGGDKALYEFIAKNLVYPTWEENEQIVGMIFVSFIIEKDGRITEPKIIKSVDGSKNFDSEVLKLMDKMPLWEPGMQRGKAVRMRYNLPIRFALH